MTWHDMTWHNMHHTPVTPSSYLFFPYATLSCALSLPSSSFLPLFTLSRSCFLPSYLSIFLFTFCNYLLYQYSICLSVFILSCPTLSCPVLAIQGREEPSLFRIFLFCHSKNVKTSFLLVIVQKEVKVLWEGLYLLWKVKMRFLTNCWNTWQ